MNTSAPARLPAPAQTPVADHLPAVAPLVARWQRLVLDARLPVLLSELLGHPEPQLAMAVVYPQYLLQWECAHGQFELAVDAAGWPALRVMLKSRDAGAAGTLLRPLFGRAWDGLATLLPGLQLAGIAAPPRTPLVGPACQGPRFSVLLYAMESSLAQHLEHVLARRTPPCADDWHALRLPARLELARRRLPLRLLRSVTEGCCFVIGPLPDASRRYPLRAGLGRVWQAAVHVDLQEHHVTLANDPDRDQEPTDGPEQPAAALRLDDVQLPVAFELDTARISLAELASMRAGQVLPLDAPASEATVRLVCCGQTVGHGQLVAVGAQLGVRILRMGLFA